MDHISLIGAPTDVGASVLGCRMGPAALRLAGIQESLERFGSEVHDCGDVTGPDNPGAFAVDGYRHLAEVTAWNHAVLDAVYAELVGGRLPIMLGGDHCLAIGSISRRRHGTAARRGSGCACCGSTRTPTSTPRASPPPATCTGCRSRSSAATGPSRCSTSSGAVTRRRPAGRAGDRPARASTSVRSACSRSTRSRCSTCATSTRSGCGNAMEMALKGVDENTHLHVSLDVDFLDDSIAPGVGTPVRGGPTYREAHLCMEMIADTGRLGSAGHRRAQPGTRRAQPDRDPRGRPRREPVRQEHPAAGAPALTPASRRERRADESRGTVGPCPCAVSTVPLRTTWPCATS
jgi:arginase